MDKFDYSDFKEEDSNSEDSLVRLRQMALKTKKAEQLVAEKELELKKAQDELRQLSEFDLPELMEEVGVPSFITEDGLKIDIKEKLRCSIAGERKGKALRWLESHGYGNIIKREFKIEFGKGEEEWAEKFEEELKRLSEEGEQDLRVAVNRNVHASTLSSFLSGLLEDGVDLPLELFGAYRQRQAKVRISSL